jgi:hypothetical protein
VPTMIVRPVVTVWTRLLSFVLSLTVLLLAVAPVLATSIQTDLWVYAQGDTVNVSGDGFDASEDVEIVTTDPYGVVVDDGTVAADPYGYIAYSFVLNSDVPGIYDVVATGLSSGLTASTQFDPAVATVTPSSNNYGSVAVGSTSAQVFTLQNTGTTVMNSIAVTISGADPSQFILNTSGTATTLAAGDSTTFAVTFTPTSIGAKSASATVGSNANPDPVLPLSGVGTAADSTAPVITKTVTGTLGANGWYTSDVTVDWTVSDPESAPMLTDCDDVTYSVETTGVTSGCSATSAGGTSSDSVTVKLDKTGPSASLAVTAGTLGLAGWYVSAVTVGTSGSDSISSPVTCSADQVFVTDTGGTLVNGSCTNDAGLSTNAAPLTVKIDATGPTAALSVTGGTLGANNWYTSNVTVHASGADDLGPVTCSADQFQRTETTGAVFNGSCSDQAGNSTNAAPLTVKLDKTGPSASLAVTAGTVGSNAWYTSDVTVSTSGSDSISSPVTCSADQFQTTETTGAVFNGSCTNDAGLSTNAAPLTVKLDKTKPTVDVTGFADGAIFSLADTLPTPDCDEADNLSGVATPATLASLDGRNVNGVGPIAYTCSGHVDNAGNPGDPVTETLYVQYDPAGLSGILQPINPDNTSLFQRGKAIPVKFRLGGDEPSGFDTTDWALIRVQASSCSGLVDSGVTEALGSVTPSSYFRYDSSADQYIYNADFKSAPVGTCWRVRVFLDDGVKAINWTPDHPNYDVLPTIMNSAWFKLQK